MTYSVSFQSVTRTDKDNVGDGFDGTVDNLSGRQLLVVAEA